MKLTADHVTEILLECLFREGEDTSSAVKAEGIMRTFGFRPERLAAHKQEIWEMLAELPDEFFTEKGGGWSFLNACMTRNGTHWGEHANIEELIALGIATGQARFIMPREMWSAFPGGMPYFQIQQAL